jgi:rod shape determining protein RodA
MRYPSKTKKGIDPILCTVIFILALISILMIGSTSYNSTGFFSRDVLVQFTAYVLGMIAIAIMLRIDINVFKDKSKFLYILALILLFTVYVPGLGIEQFGSRAWIDLKIITIQPSEIVKILFILIMASWLNENKDDLYNFKSILKAALVGAPIILIVLKEDFGSALVFVAIWLVMVFFAGINKKVLLQFLLIGAACMPISYLFMADYQKERIESFLHPNNLDIGGNYQVWQSKIAIGSGGIFGKGLFNGTQKSLDYIPVQTSDFIFSVIGEELGLIGGIVIIALYTLLLIRIMKILHSAQYFYGALIISGVIGMFIFQIFENIAMTMGLMPVTGITLPFLSYGGSSIISNMIAIGLVLNVSVYSQSFSF